MSSLAVLDNIVEEFPAQLRTPLRHFAQWTEEQLKIPRNDFLRLEHALERLVEAQARTEQRVEELAAAQVRTDHRLDTLTVQVQELTKAQGRIDQRMGELVQAQARTEQRMEEFTRAQVRTEQRMEELTRAQARTEQRMDTLATKDEMEAGFKSLSDQIAALGSRWGIYNEGTFRATIQGVFAKTEGITVKEGYYGDRQVDVIIRNGEHIMLEITSRMHSRDIDNLYRSADDYYKREGIQPILMVATSYVSPKLMQKIMGLERPIEIFSYEAE